MSIRSIRVFFYRNPLFGTHDYLSGSSRSVWTKKLSCVKQHNLAFHLGYTAKNAAQLLCY